MFRDWQYDATGQMISVRDTNTSPSSTSTYIASYDGDGRLVYESSSVTSYILRSSVLAGEVVTRLDGQGNKWKTLVTVDGLLVASQYPNGSSGPASLQWTHTDPLGLSESSTVPNGSSGNTKPTYDPLGNYVPFQAVPSNPPPPTPTWTPGPNGPGSAFGISGNPFDVACNVDGIPTNCGLAMRLLNNGTALQCPQNDCGPGMRNVPLLGVVFTGGFRATNDGWAGFLPLGMQWVGDGVLVEGEFLSFDDVEVGSLVQALAGNFTSNGQGKKKPRRRMPAPTPTPVTGTPQNSGDGHDTVPTDLKARVLDIVSNCTEFMDSYLNALGRHVYSHDFEVLLNRIKSVTIDARPFKDPMGQRDASALSGGGRIFVRPSEINALQHPQFRWNAVAMEVMQELLHQSRDRGQFSDEDLDNAALLLLSGKDLIDAKAQTKANGYEAGTLGHRTVGAHCHSTNPYGPPPSRN